MDPCDVYSGFNDSVCTSTCLGSGDCNYGYVTIYDISDTTCSNNNDYLKFPGALDHCESYGSQSTYATCTAANMVDVKDYDNDQCSGVPYSITPLGEDCECDAEKWGGCATIQCTVPTSEPTAAPIEGLIGNECEEECEDNEVCTQLVMYFNCRMWNG